MMPLLTYETNVQWNQRKNPFYHQCPLKRGTSYKGTRKFDYVEPPPIGCYSNRFPKGVKGEYNLENLWGQSVDKFEQKPEWDGT